MAAAGSKSVSAVYRRCLRAVDAFLTKPSGSNEWRDFLRSEFKKSAGTEPAAAQKLLTEAEEYAEYLTTVHAHKTLLISFNISTEKSAADQARAAASRVGLRMSHDPPANGESRDA